MIVKCLFCEYQKEANLSENILKVLADKNLPNEDYSLWVQRLFRTSIFNVLNGVKIHMGRMHKDKTCFGIMPQFDLSVRDNDILMKAVHYE